MILWVGDPIVGHHPEKFGNHRHFGNGDVMFLVAEEVNSSRSRFNLPLLFVSKGHALKVHDISYC